MTNFINLQTWFLIWTLTYNTGENAGNNCKPGKMGPDCKYEDIAYDKNTELADYTDDLKGVISRHVDNLYDSTPQFSYLANDGKNDTCSKTAEPNSTTARSRSIKPYWKVWLPTSATVRGVIFQTSDEATGIFKTGFQLFVEFVESNMRTNKTFIPTNSSLCYNSSADTHIASAMEIFCEKPLTGNQIRLQLSARNAQLVLCDIRVYKECPETRYGTACLRCSGHCRGGSSNICDRDDGHCPEGCALGWKGSICDKECANGTYGVNCQYNCSGNCVNEEPCNKVSGNCTNGCRAGFTGLDCSEKCANGTYGVNCQYNCSGNCVNEEPCNKVSGNCTNGCRAGFTGLDCSEKSEENLVSKVLKFAGGITTSFVIIASVAALVISKRRRLKRPKKRAEVEVPEGYEEICIISSSNEKTLEFDKKGPLDFNKRNEVKQKFQGAQGTDSFWEAKKDLGASNELTGPVKNTNIDTTYAQKNNFGISLSELRKYILSKSHADFESEFQSLPSGALYPTDEALKPENKGKNRYKELFPYDKCRVVLTKIDQTPGSDYINASYINGYHEQAAYIASQGPTDANVNDFWRMIYEQKVTKIIMLTKCIEGKKMKCTKYWPDSDCKMFGTIEVFLSSEEVYPDFTVRLLTIRNMAQIKDKKIHTMTQYHYTAWPDQNTPENVSSFVYFWQKARKGETVRNLTWLVHCSAGMGRTGTFIGLDYLFDEGKENGTIDIYKCVNSLRQQRINLVQKEEQYKFLHEVAYEVLCNTSVPIQNKHFFTKYSRQMKRGEARLSLLLEYELMNLNVRCDRQTKDIACTARQEDNIWKNRFQHIVPADGYTPYLTTNVSGCSNYINAVYIPMYRNSAGFIVTQNPLLTTIIDFYRLLYERKSTVIISFDQETVAEAIAPRRGSKTTVGPFLVEVTEEREAPFYKLRTIQFSYSTKISKKTVTEYMYTNWKPNANVPKDAASYMDLLYLIQRIHVKDIFRPIVVKCSDGATKSGLFCVIWNVLERMGIDEEVAIPQTIRILRHRRQQIIPDFEQFVFCYDAIRMHMEKSHRETSKEMMI